jgi:hypothetical protein
MHEMLPAQLALSDQSVGLLLLLSKSTESEKLRATCGAR